MSISAYESRVKQARRERDRQRAKQAEQEGKASKAAADALRLEQSARSTKSASLADSRRRQAERKRDDATKASDKAATASKAVAAAQRKLDEAQLKLDAARDKDERRIREKQEREEKKRERERTRRDQGRERELSSLRSETGRLSAALEAAPWANAPEEIIVLFIASSPEDQKPLRLDKEVREIQRRLRMSEYRDAVRFEVQLATQVTDLLQALNERRPHVVHFSGHSNQLGLAFEDADGNTKALDNATLAGLLNASSDRIRLAVFNSCESSTQAELACEHLDAAIGMEQSVEDDAAEQATDERSFDTAATGVLQALAKAVTQAARLLPQDEQGESRAWARDEAVLAAQVVRCSKLLRAYAQHYEQRQVELCNYIGRGLMETTIDLRYLLHVGTPELLQKFVAHSFRSDVSLREEIETNIEARDGVVLPIEDRMLSSMERRRDQAGVTPDEIPHSARETWGGSVRDKLRELGREEMYQAAFGGPSAYTHGTWHELVIYHLRPAEGGDGYYPDTAFSDVRPQPADALTVLTTEAVGEYLAKQLPETPEREELLEQLVAMHRAALEIEELHENFLGRTGGPELAE